MEDDAPPDVRPPDSPASPDDHPAASNEATDELDGVRIRQLAALRRSTYRARSFAIIFAIGGFVVAIKLVLMTIASFHTSGVGPWSLGFLMFAIVAMMVGGHFARRAMELHREANEPAPMPPAPPDGPDFSTLSDGSQQWKNLEDIK